MAIRIGYDTYSIKDLVNQPCVFYHNWISKTCRLHSADCYHYTKHAIKKLGERGDWSNVYDSYEEAYKACIERVHKDRIYNCKDCWILK